MKNLQRRVTALAAALSLAAPTAQAFEAIDTIGWPSRGLFPAYPADETRPTGVMLEAGVMRDDNVLRTENDAQADTVTRVGGAFRHEQRIVGRQRLRLDARGDYYKYDHFSNLDHGAYALGGGWLWEIGNNLAGTLTAGYVHRQADPGETQADRLDLVKSATLAGTAVYLITPRLRLRGGLSGLKEERTQAVATESRATTGTAAIEYVSPLLNTLGLEYRSTQGEAPQAVGVTGNPDYVENELAVVATYALGAQLRFTGRLGYTSRDYDEETATQHNFAGTTGRMLLEWLPGYKTILGLSVYREPRSVVDVAASHMIVSGVSFGPRWAVTNKAVLGAQLVSERRRFDGDPSIAGGVTLRDELLHLVRISFGWEPARFWQVSAALDHGERDSNIVGRDYKFNAVMGNIAYSW
ncbi:MAG TPA: hypothetical protein VH600_17235 [Burkholderiales bacterium]|jgi:hypothetical protein